MRIFLALAVCLLVIVVYPSSNSYPQPQAKSQDKPAAQDKRGTQESPLIIQGDITTKTAEKPESERKQEEEKIEIERLLAKYAGWTASITGVLVLVTAALAFATYKLWKSTHRLVKGAEDTAERQLRAYIGIDEANVIQSPETIRIHIKIKNSGQTPGYSIRTWNTFTSFDPPPHVPVFPSGSTIDRYPMLGANAALNMKAEVPIHDRAIMLQMGSGARPTFIWGEIIYKDVFKRVDRHTTFRLSIYRKAGGEWSLRTTEEGNEAD